MTADQLFDLLKLQNVTFNEPFTKIVSLNILSFVDYMFAKEMGEKNHENTK